MEGDKKMKRLITICAVTAIMVALTSTALAEGIGVAAEGPGPVPPGDWPNQYIKWDQMSGGISGWAGASFIDPDLPGYALSADDFLCTESTPVTDIHFAGRCNTGNEWIESFRITFWSDVPRTPSDESHPASLGLLYDQTIGPADPEDPYKLGWQDNLDGTFSINLPENQWFYQEGTAANPIVYWIGIQGITVLDDFPDLFYWSFVDENAAPLWGDDAAFTSDYFEVPPWSNWGWPTLVEPYEPDTYEGPFPTNWVQSADMAFVLSTVPEPATVTLLGMGALALIHRRRR
jgi:hypothetical protein